MKLFLVGGFLGSGKTTAIRQASLELFEQKVHVGVVTNDQGKKLVDSKFIKVKGIPAREVINGCFCCNFEDLENIISSLGIQNKTEVVFAESVGSCTDLIATVATPMSQFYPEIETVISIFTDAQILPSFLQSSSLFATAVDYIYKKQLDEADLLIVNKIDLISPNELENIKELVNARYPNKKVIYLNSLNKKDIKKWLEMLYLLNVPEQRRSLDLDYDIYGAGEAELAWLDAEMEIHAPHNNALELGSTIIKGIYNDVKDGQLPIGHLKFLLANEEKKWKISFTADNRGPSGLEFGKVKALRVTLLINARVQTTPGNLKKIISKAITKARVKGRCQIVEKTFVAFRPSYPNPTHRVTI